METLTDELCFLNRLDFFERMNSDLIEGKRCKKRHSVIEIGDFNIAAMICALDIIWEGIVSRITNELNDLLEKHNSLREKICYSFSFKHFNDITDEHVIEH